MKYKLTCVQFCSKCFINYKYKQKKISIVSCRRLPLAKQTETRKNTKSATLTSKILSDKNTDINKYINNKRGTLGSWITNLITKWVPLKRPFSYSQKTLQGSSLDSRLTPRPKPRFTFPTKKTKAFATLEGHWSRTVCRNGFWNRYYGHADYLLAIFLPVPSYNPRSLCES